MSSEEPDIASIFYAASQRASDERASYLDEACGDDKELRARVEHLLSANSAGTNFLDSPAPEITATLPQESVEQAGSQIGPYRLLEQIGEGGMGVVYMAEQREPVRRRVAVKVIKPGMDTRQVIARFDAERQALAMMDHPNIATVYDAGMTEAGRPYFVMELVNGVAITKYCDENRHTLHERLQLFVDVCEAVQHAHQKGIIHRDLKPSNILVAQYDGRPVPKVIDFGVVKATGQSLTDMTMYTQFGQVIGTLEYMSPEQSKRNQIDVDTRSDVYSLGVVLYELLTGSPPFDRRRLRSAALDEVLRIIREEHPPKPSTKVTSEEGLPSIAATRKIEPQRLAAFLRGELDWVLMKAIDKQRDRRYESPLVFAQDIQRYLNQQPVLAVPPSRSYLLRKYAWRNRRLLATLALFLIVLMGATVISAGLAVSRGRAVKQTADALKESRQLAGKNRLLANRESAARKTAVEERIETSRQLSRSEANQLASQAREVMETNSTLSLQLAIKSVEKTRSAGIRPVRASHQVLRDLLAYRGGYLWQTGAAIHSLAVSQDSKWIAVGVGREGLVKVYACDPNKTDVMTLSDHESPVSALAFSPNGRWLASGGGNYFSGDADTRIRMWDLRHPEARPQIFGDHVDQVTQLEFSPDGQWLVSGGSKKKKIWKVAVERKTTPRLVMEGRGTSARFSADGGWLSAFGEFWNLMDEDPFEEPASVSDEQRRLLFLPRNGSELIEVNVGVGTVHSYHPETLEEVESHELAGMNEFYQSLREGPVLNLAHSAVSPNGKWAVYITKPAYLKTDGAAIWLWNLEPNAAGQPAKMLNGHSGPIHSMDISPDGRWLVTTGVQDSLAIVWDLETTNPAETAVKLVNTVRCRAKFTHDGHWLLTWSAGVVRFWPMTDSGPGHAIAPIEVAPNESLRKLPTHPYMAMKNTLDMRPPQVMSGSGRYLVTGNEDRVARVWDLSGTKQQRTPITLPGHDDRIEFVAISETDRWVACSTRRQTRVWDLTADPSGNHSVQLTSHIPLRSLQFHPDDRYLIGATRWGKEVYLWPLPPVEDAKPIVLTHDARLLSFDIDETGTWAVTAGRNQVTIWKIDDQNPTANPIRLPKQQGVIGIASITNDGRWLLTAGGPYVGGASPHLWDLEHRSPEKNGIALQSSGAVRAASFSPDSRFLALAEGQSAYMFDLSNDDRSRRSQRLGTHLQYLDEVKFSPASNRLALVDNVNTVQVWKRGSNDSWMASATVSERSNSVSVVAFSPDGEWLATSSGFQAQLLRNSINLWNLQDEGLLKNPVRVGNAKLPFVDAAFSVDGRWLSAIDVAGTLRIWPNHLDDLVQMALARIGGQISEPQESSPATKELMRRGWAHSAQPDGDLSFAKIPTGAEFNRLAEIEGFDSINSLTLIGGVSEADLQLIARLPHLRSLTLGPIAANSEAMARLAELKNLTHLSLHGSGVDDQSLDFIKKMKTLRHFTINNSELTDQVWVSVATLPELRFLNVTGGQISSKAVQALASHPRLAQLQLNNMQIDDESLQYFKGNQVLQELSIRNAQISDVGLAALNGLRLRTLNLTGCPISGAGLAQLTEMPALKYIYLGGTRASKDEIAAFQKRVRCSVLGTR